MRLLMKAKTENQVTDFELNLKLCDSEVEMSTETNLDAVFDPNNPEGHFTLQLEKQYDQIVL